MGHTEVIILRIYFLACTITYSFLSYVGLVTFYDSLSVTQELTHWGRVTHIYVGNLTIIGSDNGLLPGRRQAIIWTNAGILLIRTFGKNFSEFFSEVHTFSFRKMRLKVSSATWRPFCLDLNVLIICTSCVVLINSHVALATCTCISYVGLGLIWSLVCDT